MAAAESSTPQKCRGNFVPRDFYARRWVVGTDFEGNRPSLRILDLQSKTVEAGDFTQLGRYVKFDVPTIMLKRITFELSTLKKVTAGEYAQVFGLPAWAADGQVAYELSRLKGKVVIPCQVLVGALFGVSVHARRQLLTPSGLGGPRIVSGRRAVLSKAPKNAEKRSSEWVSAHLSARAAWASIYAAALRGTLDMAVPTAEVDARFTGVRSGNDFFVTRMSISTLRSRDHTQHPGLKTYEFRKPGTPRPLSGGKPAVHASHLHLLSCVREGVSDAQWRAVLPLLLQGHRRVRDAQAKRRNFDLALRRYGLDCNWEAAGSRSVREQRSATYVIQRLKRLNRLEAALDALRDAERSPV